MFGDLANLSPRQILLQFLNLCLIGSTAFMSWKGLALAVDCESPIVVVLSASMEPAFARGDLLFLSNLPTLAKIGDIVVYNIKNRDIPIVHRVIKSHVSDTPAKKKKVQSSRGLRVNPFAQPVVGPQQFLLTKGDNNGEDDISLYAPGQSYLERKDDVVGIVKGFMPLVGMVTLAMNDYPWLRYILLGGMGFTALLNRE
ncbi:Signal peptidase I [Taphrina deformans PYCC 5710]|uniref:Signal peptidase complex catalytic subunit SEC11 n=1 Tax=Taphrina deformans (strain PYCC 5710 / ATCC 11124 / CBS 356.35 / IMI 108563 / JCM 9778 / NBRC 8474) TaxID=1097556 RepID=R4XFM0_TAPDE|nr:Signal peptidase I [Taphrina deformans PYCC 5710]|eukprot:CCG83282.1 Signal peptidase I [Taphrina deformans PYCC 5710]